MNFGKCGNCGLVNSASAEACQRCEHKINRNWKPVDLSTAPSEEAKKGVPFLPLLFLLVLGGGGYAFWQYGTSGEPTPAPAVAAKPVAGEKSIMDAALEPANKQEQTGKYADTIKNSKAITDANERAKEIERMTATEPKPPQKRS